MRRVLVVEDDQFVLDTIRTAFLSRGGFEVDSAGDGEAGFSALEVANLDLALIDYGLPKVPGLTLAKHALTRSIPVILMTAYGDEIAKPEEHPFPVLAKPFRVVELVDRFEQVVAEARRLNEALRRRIQESAALIAEARATHQRLRDEEWLRLCNRLRTRS